MAVVMAGLWVLQLRVRNASIADVGWCMGLIAVVLWYATQATGEIERKIFVAVLVVIAAYALLSIWIIGPICLVYVTYRLYNHLRNRKEAAFPPK